MCISVINLKAGIPWGRDHASWTYKISLGGHLASVYLAHSMREGLTDPRGQCDRAEPHHLQQCAMNTHKTGVKS